MDKRYSFNIDFNNYEGRYSVNVRDERGGVFELAPSKIQGLIDGLNQAAYEEDNKEVTQLKGLVAELMRELAEIKGMLGAGGSSENK